MKKVPPEIKNMSIQLLVSDLNRSIEFYTKTLGFTVDFIYEGFYCGLVKDGCSIHLKSASPAPEERENRKNNEHADIIFSVENIEVLFKKLIDTAAEITIPLRQMLYGTEFYLSDPDGYIIAFVEEV